MPVETIGECGTPGASREWISAQATLAIRFITEKCGFRLFQGMCFWFKLRAYEGRSGLAAPDIFCR